MTRARASTPPALRVWAPAARRVDAVTSAGRARMGAAGGGWWQVSAPAAAADGYRFSVDGGEPLPDPRSAHQPQGVHGPSRPVDHRAFGWTDGRWRGAPLAGAVLYELHVGTFSAAGTFDGVIEHLGSLTNLGVTAIELMPVAEFPGRRGWGYDGVALYAPHHAYGGPEGLRRLVDAAHAHGLAVVLDVVYNHLGPDGNHLGEYGPYFTDAYRTPWGAALNYDQRDSDEVRRFVIDNALMWLRDYHLDGLRLDAVHAIIDTSATHLLEALAVAVQALQAQLGRTLWVIAESDLNDPRLVRTRDAGGYGLDAAWSDDFHHALHAAMSGERAGYYSDFGSIAQLAHVLQRGYLYDGRRSAHRARQHGRPFGALPATRLLAYMQNHDQVGNRALGERSGQLLTQGQLRVAAALVLLGPFVPMLFAGEEWGSGTPFQYFTDHGDRELGGAVTQGRRREFASFGWAPELVPNPQDESTYLRSRLDRGQLCSRRHRALWEWHRRLIALRRAWPELSDGDLEGVHAGFDEAARWLHLRHGRVHLACSFGTAAVLTHGGGADAQVLLASPGSRLTRARVHLPRHGVLVWSAPMGED